MKLAWMMLSNYAEAQGGLVYITGGAWDTLNVHAPLPDPPEGPSNAVAVMKGTVAVRLLFHLTETDQVHSFGFVILGEDGDTVAQIEGDIDVRRDENLPPGWDQGVSFTLPVQGIPLPRFGRYQLSLQVDGTHVEDLPFRVVKRY